VKASIDPFWTNLSDGIYFVDRQRRITYWNRGAERISGHRADEVIGSFCHDNLPAHVDDRGCQLCHVNCPLVKTIRDGKQREADIYLKHKNGSRLPVRVRVSPISDATGQRIIGAAETFSDNAAQLAATQIAKTLNQLAYVDPLTDTGNRRFTDARLREDLAKSDDLDCPIGVLFLDIDSFKEVNDRYGHDAGDQVLQMTAGTLTANLRSCDFVGRWGGDEFLVILTNSGPKETQRTAKRLRALIGASRIRRNNQMLGITVSIGATTLRSGDTPKSIIKRADELLYCSKREGRNRVTCYFPERNDKGDLKERVFRIKPAKLEMRPR
jgi:diguanylate cyclase (GGDEF)-like protein/PAS domain S-box-containing protein